MPVERCAGYQKHWSDWAGEPRFGVGGDVRFGSRTADPARHPERLLLSVQRPNLHPMAGMPQTAAVNRRVRDRLECAISRRRWLRHSDEFDDNISSGEAKGFFARLENADTLKVRWNRPKRSWLLQTAL